MRAKLVSSQIEAGCILLLLLALPACSKPSNPLTKEAYLGDYSTFVTLVEQDAGDYRYRHWNKADAHAEYLNKALYERFAPELTTEEQFKIIGYRARYLAAKVKWTVREGVQKALGKNRSSPFPG
ncbi:MAG: DUF6565 domain-containing protein [Saprospiraceae bacterium]|nr:DUF6565 domain-containing protein [Saprospiraceae bacterium]